MNPANQTRSFVTDKILQTAWAGATYETGPWAFTAAYYLQNQNNYSRTSSYNAATLARHKNAAAKVGGDLNWVSGVVDYKFNKHFDVYTGVSWVDYTGAWAS